VGICERLYDILFDLLDIAEGSHVAMVGLFRPLVKKLQDIGAHLEMVDIGGGLGDFDLFPDKLS